MASRAPLTTAPYPRWWFVLAIWTAWGLLLATQVTWYTSLGTRPTPFLTALRLNMPGALVWAVFTPAAIWLARRLPPFEGPHWPRGVAVHVVASAVAVFLEVLLVTVNGRWVRGPMPDDGPMLGSALRWSIWWYPSDCWLYWVIVAADYGVTHYRRLRERELRASQLEAQLAEARLQALKTQLQPHFLFNALHTIGQLVRTGQDALAVQVVAGLGDLLRRVLDGAGTQEVSLKQELEFLRSYLDVEQVRFRDRLKAVVDAEPDTLDARVPYLILQPLVENAIRHGIAPRATTGRLLISARRIAGRLHLTVRDDGSGLVSGGMSRDSRGVGLANTSERLRQLYGDAASFEVVGADDGGTVARIVVPFRLAAAEWERGA